MVIQYYSITTHPVRQFAYCRGPSIEPVKYRAGCPLYSWQIWEQRVEEACGVALVAALPPVIPTGSYRPHRGTTAIVTAL